VRRRLEPASLAIAGTVVLVLLLVATRYGWHRDEFYYVASGKHLAWGYVDNPPLTPLVARIATAIAAHNLFALRFFPALVAGGTVLLGSVIVGELGGGRAARVMGAAVVAAGGFVLGVGHLLATPGIDGLAWLALIAITCRLLRTQDPRWWLAFGLVAGVAMLNKSLVVMLVVALGAGLVVERQWRLLRSPWLVVGALLAMAIAAPTLVWQAQHDWAQVEFARALAERIGMENRITLVPLQLLFVGPAFIAVGWRGVQWLRRGEGEAYRTLLWAAGLVVVFVFVSGGRPYYAVPVTTTLVLAGIAPTLANSDTRRFLRLVIPNAVLSALFALPLLPASASGLAASLNETVAEQIGWTDLAAQVHDVAAALPPADQRDAIVLAGSYGEAGALDFYRDRYALPPVFSPHNSYADFGQPTNDDATVITVRFDRDELRSLFRDCRVVAHADNHLDVHNEVYGTPIAVCRGLRHPWSVTWDRMRFFS
jgi:4-amino-4-deoxy-L-arabinose transferase-like glycosyltransferase